MGNWTGRRQAGAAKGFTLIELLVVVVIVGILAAVAAPNLIGQTDKARTTEATAVLASIKNGQAEYNFKHPGEFVTIGQPTAAGQTRVPAKKTDYITSETDLGNPATPNTEQEQTEFQQILGISVGQGTAGARWNFATAGHASVFNPEGDVLVPSGAASGEGGTAQDYVAIAKGLDGTNETARLGAQIVHSQNRTLLDAKRQ
ncbi:prepilin-type N-terminal cleavage/methylation domain-containing protein [Gloeobacter violaceus]|nr:prepilin-type N-terminal cleavage/methylation domain-containing protein [Gloeobacter violaceus]